MASTLEKNLSKFNATQKDTLGSGFGVLERNVQKISRGNHEVKVKLVYDFAVDGAIAVSGGTAALREVGSSSAFVLPTNCQVTRLDYQVKTTFTSGTDAAQLSIGIPTDDAEGLVAEAAISAAGNPWDATAKLVAGIQTGATSAYSEVTTAERNIVLKNDNGSEATTAGKIYVHVTYVELD